MEIDLRLKNYCIKAAAKKLYEESIKKYFKSQYSNEERLAIENQIDVLAFFLKNVDFPKLRALYPELSGVNELLVKMTVPENSYAIKICFNKKIINLNGDVI